MSPFHLHVRASPALLPILELLSPGALLREPLPLCCGTGLCFLGPSPSLGYDLAKEVRGAFLRVLLFITLGKEAGVIHGKKK